ncbi:MAG: ATP-binding cassette domain-containing protein [Bdellovibrionota bacterium]
MSVRITNVAYNYPASNRGIKNISFVLESGKIACLLGPSGAGKSTLLKIVAGLVTPDSGEVFIHGQKVAAAKKILVPIQRREIGIVFQQHALFPHMTVAENILFGCRRKKAERQSFLNQLLQEFQIEIHKDKYPHEISGGEAQRVAVARAIASEPRVLLMDEPFSSLDQSLRAQVEQQCLTVIRERKLTALIVTHDEISAKGVADLIIRIDQSRE